MMLASLGQTVPPKVVPITAATKDGVSEEAVYVGEDSPDQTAASVWKA